MISRQNPPAPPPLLRCGCRRGWVLSSLLRPAPASCGPLPGLWTLWTPDNDTLQSTSHITCNRSHMEHNTRLGTGGHYRLLSSPCNCTAPIRRSPSSLNTLITQSTALLHHRNTVTTDHWAEYLLNTGCTTIEYSLCFGCFLGFQCSYRCLFYHFSTAQEMTIPKLTLLSSLRLTLIKLQSKT